MDIGNDVDDFEFKTNMGFGIVSTQPNHHQQRPEKQEQVVEDPSKISFVDELFSNHQVLPLKLPPRLQYSSNGKSSNKSAKVSSPKSPILVFKGPFFSMSFKNNDCDPFMAALEHVRKEGRERDRVSLAKRRTQSLSQIKVQWTNESSRDLHHQDRVAGPRAFSKHPMGHMRSVSTGYIEPRASGATMLLEVNPPVHVHAIGITGSTNKLSESFGPSKNGSKRQRFKDFLFKGVSKGRANPKDKQRGPIVALKGSTNVKHAHGDPYTTENHELKELRKKTYLLFKSRLLVCLGFGSNGA